MFYRSQDETLPMESNIPVKSGVSASDISDAELPSQSDTQESSDNVEELEKARAELLVNLKHYFTNFLLTKPIFPSTL